MLACYLDEAGDTGTLTTATSPIQPVLCLLGLTLNLERLREFTLEFTNIKTRFFPGLFPAAQPRLEKILKEVKGSDIRAAFRTTRRDRRRRHHHIGFLDALFTLVETYGCRVFGRVWVKAIGVHVNSVTTYTSSIQAICSTFQHLLVSQAQSGCMILDPRTKTQDRRVSFSIFTQKFKATGDAYPRLIEMPTFGQGENHAGIQVADLLCSGVLFPLAAYTYCTGHVNNIHVNPGYAVLKNRYGTKLRALQHRYYDGESNEWLGGIVTSC